MLSSIIIFSKKPVTWSTNHATGRSVRKEAEPQSSFTISKIPISYLSKKKPKSLFNGCAEVAYMQIVFFCQMNDTPDA